jgi:hypothetical protein
MPMQMKYYPEFKTVTHSVVLKYLRSDHQFRNTGIISLICDGRTTGKVFVI